MSAEMADKKCVAIQKMVFDKVHKGLPVNSFEPHRTPETNLREDGIVYRNDLSYESKYPNGYFDLWYPDDTTAERPTVIYIHGGGFLFGDKAMGDPLASGNGEKLTNDFALVLAIVRQGYNVVSMNYAFAPTYRFPVQIFQLNELVGFLVRHAGEFHLDMSRVSIGGGSAGADMSAIYGLVLTQPSYAAELGITPAIAAENVKCLVIDEAGLDLASMDEGLRLLMSCWVGEDKLEESRSVMLMDVAPKINSSYPPAYIVTSNKEYNFIGCADKLDQAMTDHHVDHRYYKRGKEVEELPHGFVSDFRRSPCGREALEDISQFVTRYLK